MGFLHLLKKDFTLVTSWSPQLRVHLVSEDAGAWPPLLRHFLHTPLPQGRVLVLSGSVGLRHCSLGGSVWLDLTGEVKWLLVSEVPGHLLEEQRL